MICDTIGLTADSYASMYVHGGLEVEEVYGGLNYAQPIFYKMQTITGTAPIAFDSYPGHLTDYTILGNSYQDGTPTPDDPVEVVGCGDRTENLFDKDAAVYGAYINEDGTVTQEGAVKTAWLSGYIPVTAGSTYTLNKTGSRRGKFYKADKTPYQTATMDFSGLEKKNTFTVPETVAYIRFNIFKDYATPDDIMLNLGSTARPYESYGYKIPITCGGVTQNIYLDEPLRKQLNGDAADALNYATQTLTRRVDENCDPLVTPTTEFVTLPQIPTISGANTLSVGTTVQPSSVSITGHIKPVTS